MAPVRKALGVRTAFNIVGPLLNAAGAQHVVVGVFQEVGESLRVARHVCMHPRPFLPFPLPCALPSLLTSHD